MTTLNHHCDTAESLRAHLNATLPDADIRVWRVSTYGIQIHVGPEFGLWSDLDSRPELFRVARAIDPFITEAAFKATHRTTYWSFRWSCTWDGVPVAVEGEGKGEPVVAPKPLPELGVAA